MNFQSLLKWPMLILFLCAVGIMAYAQVLYYPFVHDDVIFIQTNPTIQTINLHDIFIGTDAVRPASLINAYYRPMLELFYRLEYQLFHLNPMGYHLVNVLMHIVNSVLLMLIFQRIFKNLPLAFTISLMFLIHPLQTEAVSCIVGISNLLFAFFLLVSIFYYLRQDKSVVNFICSLTFFLAALFTKEQAVVLPMLLVLYEFFQGKNKTFVDKFKAISGHLVILCFYLTFRKMAVGHTGVDLGSGEEIRLRLLAIPSTLLTYLQIMLVPRGLHYYRSADILLPFLQPTVALGGIIALVCFSLRWLNQDDKKMVLFGLGWFLIALLPMLNILPLVNEYSFILTSEHFLYLPLIGMVIVVAGYFRHCQRHVDWLNRRWVVGGMIVMITLVYFSLTIRQTRYWRSEVALFERMITFEKDFARGHILLGRAYYFDRQLEKSVEHYDKAVARMQYYLSRISNVELKKFYEGLLKEIYFDVSHVYQTLGDKEKTIYYYKALIELDPYFSKGLVNFGVYYASLGEDQKALEYFNRATVVDPYDPVAWQNLLILSRRIGDLPAVKKAYESLKRIEARQ